MSWRALQYAVRDAIRENCGYKPAECDLMLGGQPAPGWFGDYFVAIHRGPVISQQKTCLDEKYELLVTVTKRVRGLWDRIAVNDLNKQQDGLEDKAHAIAVEIHADALDYHVTNAANKILQASYTENPPFAFMESLSFLGDQGEPQAKGGDWFHADPAADDCGLALVLRFGGARRIQVIGGAS